MLYSLRPELEFSRQTQHGSSYVVVKDPITFRYFQFRETHAVISAILALVRSPIDIETLSAIVSERVGAKVNPTSLNDCSIPSIRNFYSTPPPPAPNSKRTAGRRLATTTLTFSTSGWFQ